VSEILDQASQRALRRGWLERVLNITLQAASSGPTAADRSAIAESAQTLLSLLPRVRAAVLARSPRAAVLQRLVNEAHDLVQSRDAEGARSKLTELGAELAGDGRSPLPQAPGIAFRSARLRWDSARKDFAAELTKLEVAIREYYADKPDEAELAGRAKNVHRVMTGLDDQLGDALDSCISSEPAKLKPPLDQALTVLRGYAAFIEGDEIMRQLPGNPFLPIRTNAIRQTVYDLLTTLRNIQP